MKYSIKWIIGFYLLVWSSPLFSISPAEIMEKVEKKIEKAGSVRLVFEETYVWELTEEKHVNRGTLILSGRNKFRIETTDQVIVSNGTELRRYNQPNNQVLIESLDKSKTAMLPRRILFRYKETYKAENLGLEKMGSASCYHLEFTSTSGDEYFPKISVWVNKDTWMIEKVMQVDLHGNVTTFRLSGIELGISISSDTFALEVPAGTEVIDMR